MGIFQIAILLKNQVGCFDNVIDYIFIMICQESLLLIREKSAVVIISKQL